MRRTSWIFLWIKRRMCLGTRTGVTGTTIVTLIRVLGRPMAWGAVGKSSRSWIVGLVWLVLRTS
ncbi:hypothetical protein LINPERPRIM_LOCUS3998 [Linum perenne]